MAKLGDPPMPWQKYGPEVALELDPGTAQPRRIHDCRGRAFPRRQGVLHEADQTTNTQASRVTW